MPHCPLYNASHPTISLSILVSNPTYCLDFGNKGLAKQSDDHHKGVVVPQFTFSVL